MAYGNKFKVIGVLKETGSFFGGQGADRVLALPLAKAEVLAAGKNITYDITVMVDDPTQLGQVMGLARGVMRNVRRDQPLQDDSFEINKSETLSASLEQVTSSLRVGGFGIGIITLLGAAIGLMNIMLVSVTERTHEIGLRKSVGATPFHILQQFLVEAVLICLIGGSMGIVLGILLGNLVGDFIGATSFIIPWVWILVGYAFCVGVGVASGMYPAVKASKLDPIEALRFE
jgi:putative ABC transport system permease protein